jgi:hypothetical protein
MRYKLLFLVLLLEILLTSAVTVRATDLRGGVIGVNQFGVRTGPFPGAGVALFGIMPDGTFALVRQTVTGLDGIYYLGGIFPGQYVLQVGGLNYPLQVGVGPMQDIPILAAARYF